MLSSKLNMKLLIIGVGHLSKILLEEIQNDGTSLISSVSGTYRTKSKLEDLGLDDLIAFDHAINSTNEKSYDFVLFTLPPIDHYLEILEAASNAFSKTIPWIFISSTGVYGNGRNAKVLVSIERFLQKLDRKVVIIRPGGLIDENRNPIFSLAKRDEVLAFNQTVNVVHTRDVARFIKYVIEKNIREGNFDLVSDDRMTKKEFYLPFFDLYNLKYPQFIDTQVESRRVSNSKSKEIGFEYIAPAIFDYISKED